MYKKYVIYRRIYFDMHYVFCDLNFSKTQSFENICDYYEGLSSLLKELISYLFTKVSDDIKKSEELNLNNKVAKKNSSQDISIDNEGGILGIEENSGLLAGKKIIKEEKRITEDFNIDDDEKKNIKFKSILEDYFYESKCSKKQNLLREMKFDNLIIKIMENILEHGFLKDRTANIKVNLLRQCLVVLIFYVKNNEKNQIKLSENASFQDLIKKLILIEKKHLQQLIILLFAEAHKNNYLILLNLEKSGALENLKKFCRKFDYFFNNKKSKDFCVYFFQLMNFFFKIKNNFLHQNKLLLVSILNEKSSSSSLDLIKPIQNCFNFCINKSIEEYTIAKSNKIEVPTEMIILIAFLNTFSEFSLKNSSKITDYLRQFFTLKDIQKFLNTSKMEYNWYPLKLEFLNYIINVYIYNKKLEESELGDIQSIIMNTLYQTLKDFITQTNINEKYKNFSFCSQIENILKIPYFSATQKKIIDVNFIEIQELYLVYGVLKTLQAYLDKIPTKPDDNDLVILESYTFISNELNIKWEMNNIENSAESMGNVTKLRGISAAVSVINPRGKSLYLSKRGEGSVAFPSSNNELYHFDSRKSLYDPQIRFTNFQKSKKKSISKVISELKDFLSNIFEIMTKNKVLNFEEWKSEEENEDEEIEENRIKKKKKKNISFILNDLLIEQQHGFELDFFISFLVEMKTCENDSSKFRKVVQGFINVITLNEADFLNKVHTMKILRKLLNFKKNDPKRNNLEIQRDLVEIGLMNTLCKVFAHEKNEKLKFEYILGLVDFLDEANKSIQESFYEYLMNDENNLFLLKINAFIHENFNEFREYEKNSYENSQVKSKEFRKIENRKIFACINAMELLRLSCENHYKEMQNFLREQIQKGKKNLANVNLIIALAELLEKYIKSKMINENNIQLGEKLLDTLVEFIQGPCTENQVALCNTKILENLEDIILTISSNLKRVEQKLAGFTNKMITFLLSLFEGNNDLFVLSKLYTFFSPDLLFNRMEDIYTKYYKMSKKIVLKNFLDRNKVKKKLKDYDISSEKYDLPINMSFSNNFKEENDNDEKNVFDEDKIDLIMAEGFNIFILIKSLKFLNPNIREKIKKFKLEREREESEKSEESLQNSEKALKHYKNNVAMIEIVNSKNELQRLYFRLHPITKYLSTVTQERFRNTVSRESANEKINGLLKEFPLFFEEMKHFMKLRAWGLKFSLSYLFVIRFVKKYRKLLLFINF